MGDLVDAQRAQTRILWWDLIGGHRWWRLGVGGNGREKKGLESPCGFRPSSLKERGWSSLLRGCFCWFWFVVW